MSVNDFRHPARVAPYDSSATYYPRELSVDEATRTLYMRTSDGSSNIILNSTGPMGSGTGTDSMIIGEGIASGDYSVAGGTTDTSALSDLVGSYSSLLTNLNPAEASGDMSLSFGADTKSISTGSISVGARSIAGCKGFYWSKITFNSNGSAELTLSTSQSSKGLFGNTINTTWSQEASNQLAKWSVGDVISITNEKKYVLCSKISKINNTASTASIVVESVPFTSAVYLYTSAIAGALTGSLALFDDYGVSCPSKPEAGVVELGLGAIAIGLSNKAAGSFSLAQGYDNISAGDFSAVVGLKNTVGYGAFASGESNTATGIESHAEGYGNTAAEFCAHAEGGENTAIGPYSHVEGRYNRSIGVTSHAEGYQTTSYGSQSHAEGHSYSVPNDAELVSADTLENKWRSTDISQRFLVAYGNYSHAEGQYNLSLASRSHAEGWANIAKGNASHVEGRENEAIGAYSHSGGLRSVAAGEASLASGIDAKAFSKASKSLGYNTLAGYPVIINLANPISIHSPSNTISSDGSVNLDPYIGYGVNCTYRAVTGNLSITGKYKKPNHSSLLTGYVDIIISTNDYQKSFRLDGFNDYDTRDFSIDCILPHDASTVKLIIQPYNDYFDLSDLTAIITSVNGNFGQAAVAIGTDTMALGDNSFAGGYKSVAPGNQSVAIGTGVVSQSENQYVQGTYNIVDDEDKYLHIVGNGTEEDVCDQDGNVVTQNRSNAYTLDKDGNGWYKGEVEGNDIKTSSGVRLTRVASDLESLQNTVNNLSGLSGDVTNLVNGLVGKKTDEGGEIFNDERNKATAEFAHAEGRETQATGNQSHAEGYATHATGANSHAEGGRTKATQPNAHAEGIDTQANANAAHAEGNLTQAIGLHTHAEGHGTLASGRDSHAEGMETRSYGRRSHSEGNGTIAGMYKVNESGKFVTSGGTVLENQDDIDNRATLGDHSHVEGYYTRTVGENSHAEGYQTVAFGDHSHVEGYSTVFSEISLSDLYNTLEKDNTDNTSNALTSVLGYWTTRAEDNKFAMAFGNWSHAEGQGNLVTGSRAHVQGWNNLAKGIASHVEGYGNISSASPQNIAKYRGQHVQGHYNIEDTEFNYLHILGNGTSHNNRSNAHTIDHDGNAWFSGDVFVGGNSQSEGTRLPKIYTGTTEPTSDIGVDGDIFIVYEN